MVCLAGAKMSSDDNFHSLIKKSLVSGRIELGVDWVRLNRPDSPMYRWTDHNLPGLLVTAAVVLNFYLGGWVWGLISLTCSVVLFFWLIRKWGFSRLDKRTRQYVLASSDNWWRLWEFGGLNMRLTGSDTVNCVSPGDSWRDFAREYLLPQKDESRLPPELQDLPDLEPEALAPEAAPARVQLAADEGDNPVAVRLREAARQKNELAASVGLPPIGTNVVVDYGDGDVYQGPLTEVDEIVDDDTGETTIVFAVDDAEGGRIDFEIGDVVVKEAAAIQGDGTPDSPVVAETAVDILPKVPLMKAEL